MKNVSASVYDALIAEKFSLFLKIEEFNQTCYANQVYNYTNDSYAQPQYQIK